MTAIQKTSLTGESVLVERRWSRSMLRVGTSPQTMLFPTPLRPLEQETSPVVRRRLLVAMAPIRLVWHTRLPAPSSAPASLASRDQQEPQLPLPPPPTPAQLVPASTSTIPWAWRCMETSLERRASLSLSAQLLRHHGLSMAESTHIMLPPPCR